MFIIASIQQKKIAWIATLIWYGIVYGYQIRWFYSPKYQSHWILIAFVLALFLFAVPMSWILYRAAREKITLSRGIFWSCVVALFEFSKLWAFTGFPYNPLGRVFLSTKASTAYAIIFGTCGLAFLSFFLPYMMVYFFQKAKKRLLKMTIVVCSFYLIGFCLTMFPTKPLQHFRALVVQTGVLCEEKNYFIQYHDAYISSINHWKNAILQIENVKRSHQPHLIIFPEILNIDEAEEKIFTTHDINQLPFPIPLDHLPASNLDIAKALAIKYQTPLLINFYADEGDKTFSRVFLLDQRGQFVAKYDKKMLVPIAETLPLPFFTTIARAFGISSSFTSGEHPTVFPFTPPFSTSVCIEEGYGYWLQKMRRRGAKFFINMTNDAWYPGTILPYEHELLGRLRSVENGVYSIRVANTGATSLIDEKGNVVDRLPYSFFSPVKAAKVFSFSMKESATPYSLWGEYPLLIFCALYVWKRRNPLIKKK